MAKLNQQQIEHLRDLMGKRWAREFSEIRPLLADLDEDEQRGAFGEPAAHLSDEALLDTLSAINEALIQHDLQDVRDIVAARQRILAGTFGACTDCGGDIGYDRQLAYPTAKRCIDCQRKHERGKTAHEGGNI